MPEILTYVYINLEGKDIPVGRLWSYFNNGKESASFRYDESWLKFPCNFELEPYLPLTEGTGHTDNKKSIFASMSDCSPDTWGRLLIKRNEEKLAEQENRLRRQLNQLDYLLAVNDFSRQGALRFKQAPDGDFLTAKDKKAIPPLVELPKLLAASEKIIDDDASFNDIKELLIPGSSLGGARPKATVVDTKDQLWIAKFPSKNDENDTGAWEMVAHDLAALCGLNVPEAKLEKFSPLGSTFLIKRFDRMGSKRVHFASARTLLGKTDGASAADGSSYLDIAAFIKSYGAQPKKDLGELWKRIVFNMAAVSYTHLTLPTIIAV